MVMHEQVSDQGLYNWYIDTVILGTSLTPELTVVEGGNSKIMDANVIAALPGKLLNYDPPIPRGYRKPLPSPDRDVQTEGAFLRNFLTSDNFNEVILTPYVGNPVTLKKDDLNKPIVVLRSFDNQKILSAYGRPYSVVFPVAEHPDLAGQLRHADLLSLHTFSTTSTPHSTPHLIGECLAPLECTNLVY